MAADSELHPAESAAGASSPPRPFVPGRESVELPVPNPGGRLPRPFRAGYAARDMKRPLKVAADSVGPSQGDLPGRLPGTWIEEVAQPADNAAELLPSDEVQATEVMPQADLTPPPVSSDPLSDVGWLAAPSETELDMEAETLALIGAAARAPAAPTSVEGPGTTSTPDSPRSVLEEIPSEEDSFAAKLEALAAAIRRGKLDELLAENPHDALTALVAGYYAGTAGRRGGSGS